MRRFYQFGLCFLFILITVVAVYSGWHLSQTRLRQRTTAHELVSVVLLQKHWTAFETNDDLQPVVKLLSSEFSNSRHHVRVLLANGTFRDDSTPDAFELQFLRDASVSLSMAPGGVAPRAERLPQGKAPYRYYRAVYATKTECVDCHRVMDKNPLLVEDDLISVVKIEIRE